MSNTFKNILYYTLISLAISVLTIYIYHYKFGEQFIILEKESKVKEVSLKNKNAITKTASFADIVKNSSPAVVSINILTKDNENKYNYESGSGVIISPNGHIVTNVHVVKNAEDIKVTTLNNMVYKAKIVAIDELTDLAVIKIDVKNSKLLFFGESENLNIGDWVITIGNPFNLQNSVSAGIVSAKNRRLDILGKTGVESYIQTDAVVNPGNSGGAMIDTNGKLVGLVSAIVTDNDNYQGYSFAIPSEIAKKVTFDLINFKTVQRAWLGVTVQNIEGNKGIKVNRVNNNSSAKIAGIINNDIITHINAQKITSVPQFETIISTHYPGDTITLSLLRHNKKITLKPILQNSLQTTELISNRSDEILNDLGFVLRNLTKQEKNTLKVDGAYVVSITRGSKIYNVNMEPGYIITEINNQKISSVDDFISKLQKSENTVSLMGIYKNYPGKYPYVFEKK